MNLCMKSLTIENPTFFKSQVEVDLVEGRLFFCYQAGGTEMRKAGRKLWKTRLFVHLAKALDFSKATFSRYLSQVQ